MRKIRDGITQETFDELLAWLDPNRAEAANKYESIRSSLVQVFSWRKCADPEGMADSAINRVARKVRDLRSDYEGDPARYFHGVARNMLREYENTRRLEVSLSNRELAAVPPFVDRLAELERIDDCLRSCLRALPHKHRRLLMRYYAYDKREKAKRRQQMAHRLGIEQGALRVRIFRLRTTLEECMKQCLHKKEQ
jgi:RNA polymerase sigma factor (sigma-70 family)